MGAGEREFLVRLGPVSLPVPVPLQTLPLQGYTHKESTMMACFLQRRRHLFQLKCPTRCLLFATMGILTPLQAACEATAFGVRAEQ